MQKVNGVNLSLLLKNKKVSTETQIYYLKKVGEILNKLKYIRETTPLKDFYINDLHDFNFLADISAFLIGPNSLKVIIVITINASINML